MNLPARPPTRQPGFLFTKKIKTDMTEVEYQKYIRDFDKKIAFCLSIHCDRTAARWARDKEAFIKEHEQSKTNRQ